MNIKYKSQYLWKKNNPEKVKEYRRNNKDKHRLYARKWAREHPEAQKINYLKNKEKTIYRINLKRKRKQVIKRLNQILSIRLYGRPVKKKKITRYYYNLNPVKYKYYSYKSRAKTRGKEWKLSYNVFKELWQKSCYYCGSEIKTIGIDRVDNSKGYILNNIVPCCETCNKAKLCLSENDFIEHCKRIVKHHQSRLATPLVIA